MAEAHQTFLKSIPEVKTSPTVSPSASPIVSNEGLSNNGDRSSESSERSAFGEADWNDPELGTKDCDGNPNCVATESVVSQHRRKGSFS